MNKSFLIVITLLLSLLTTSVFGQDQLYTGEHTKSVKKKYQPTKFQKSYHKAYVEVCKRNRPGVGRDYLDVAAHELLTNKRYSKELYDLVRVGCMYLMIKRDDSAQKMFDEALKRAALVDSKYKIDGKRVSLRQNTVHSSILSTLNMYKQSYKFELTSKMKSIVKRHSKLFVDTTYPKKNVLTVARLESLTTHLK